MEAERPFASLTLQNSEIQSQHPLKVKLVPKVVFLPRDSEGVASAIADALHPSPSFSAQRVEQPCELPLDRYGIRDQMTRGFIVNFIDNGIHRTLCKIGELLESTTSLCFSKDMFSWNPSKSSEDGEEPWRALYG